MLERLETWSEPSASDMPLWRFMDFTKYVAMLHRHALFFSRADQLPDPFEGASGRRVVRHLGDESAARRRVFLSCWHQNAHESAAMWRIYLTSGEGVALRSSIARLEDAFSSSKERLHVGSVRYLDYEKEAPPRGDELTPFFCKRKNFDYEREVRVLWRSESALEEPGRYIAAELGSLIEEVVVSPSAEPWLEELVGSVTAKYGLRLRVTASTMADCP
jgi:hypothetical protein